MVTTRLQRKTMVLQAYAGLPALDFFVGDGPGEKDLGDGAVASENVAPSEIATNVSIE